MGGVEFLTTCHSGGYGLIQWTSVGRYNNLGKFCKKYDCDPSSLEVRLHTCLMKAHSNVTFLNLKVVDKLSINTWCPPTTG